MNVFEILFPNLKMGKHEFDIILPKGDYVFSDSIVIGAGKLEYSLFIFGGEATIPYNTQIFNPNFSLSNITNVISTFTNFLGTKGVEFTLKERSKIDVVVYVNEEPQSSCSDSKLILIIKKLE